ncbi:MAG: hypothetical protein K2N35_06235 [Muribaculaceae bacterium]|nr:hypothetical protein [Muribaculaceae bacterium]
MEEASTAESDRYLGKVLEGLAGVGRHQAVVTVSTDSTDSRDIIYTFLFLLKIR